MCPSWKFRLNGLHFPDLGAIFCLRRRRLSEESNRVLHTYVAPTDDSAIKNLGEKAEGILEEQKKKVEELAVEKKNAAAALLEQQKEKIGDLLWQTKSEAESSSNDLKQAVEGFESELSKETDKVVDDTVQQVSGAVDEKLKESEQFLDEKREEAVKSLSSAGESLNPSAVLGKAKGFLNF